VPLSVASSVPNFIEGFGRIQLDNALYFSDNSTLGKLQIYDAKVIQSQELHSYCYQVSSTTNSGPLIRATLVWTDYPSTPYQGGTLVNNLDLCILDVAQSSLYLGNQQINNNNWDPFNNVEQVTLSSFDVTGTSYYSVHVRGTNVPKGPQSYALVITGSTFQPVTLDKCGNSSLICPGNCNGHGLCQDGLCLCDPDYYGVGCQGQVIPLTQQIGSETIFFQLLGNPVTILDGDWGYYSFDITNGSVLLEGLSIYLRRNALLSPDLFVAYERIPTPADCDANYLASGKSIYLYLPRGQVKVGRYYIGTHGYSGLGDSLINDLQVQSAPTTGPASESPKLKASLLLAILLIFLCLIPL